MVHCPAMPTWKLTIEYKGTRYLGWQEQPRGRTIQGELKAAARDYLGELVDLGGSGRTDAGVHALAQVAHLRTLKKRTADQIQLALNERLPADIHVTHVEPSLERFHARHSAVARYYLYQISLRRTAFAKEYVWWVKGTLELKRMEDCARLFLGKHDFRSFTEKPAEQGSTLVVVEEARVKAVDDLVLIRLGASHFLWRMVRRLVGVMVQAALGELEIDQIRDFLVRSSPDVGKWTAPAAGLFLERVIYPSESGPHELMPVTPLWPKFGR